MLKRILIVDDETNIRLSLQGALEDEGYVVESARDGKHAIELFRNFAPDVVLLDIWMPGEDGLSVLEKIRSLDSLCDVIMMSGHGTVETAVKAIKLGAFDFIEKPINIDKLQVVLGHAFSLKQLKRENAFLRHEIEDDEHLTANSPAMQKVLRMIEVAAPSNGWVLLQGEHGCGRELVARTLHSYSPRKSQRFVSIDCAKLSPVDFVLNLLGSDSRPSLLEKADGGSLFLEEVHSLDDRQQDSLLTILKEVSLGHFPRTGTPLDVRVISSSAKDLAEMVKSGLFSEELFFRLSVIPVRVPSLRERKEDIPDLAEEFLGRYRRHRSQVLDNELMQLMLDYHWPANVRELKNWVERACLITEDHLVGAPNDIEMNSADSAGLSLREARANFEKTFITQMLRKNEGNISRTANAIGIERSHLHKKIKVYGIELAGSQ